MIKYSKGNSIIEVLGALAIVLVTISIAYRISFIAEKIIRNNEEMFNRREIVNAVCNEIKYNIQFDELTNRLLDKPIFINYDKTLLDKLKEEPLMNLVSEKESNKTIVISLEEKNNERLFIKINFYGNGKVIKKEVVKGRWMDYV
ncbi:hypothetical protein SAMN04487886_100154 [Clostridium sp. DSM 8431]|uniref:hypothetical protein n=1 Tax=Clostridium sp. DSM 8431 TaxID=1761781 RepID=UPI0008E79229|nr:hypothetical protein [Clostridium sp. DSM 8431]SFU28613.1 hypothetical protein SAMN04487886_100154 [Clostridium sp. DSM 8431]